MTVSSPFVVKTNTLNSEFADTFVRTFDGRIVSTYFQAGESSGTRGVVVQTADGEVTHDFEVAPAILGDDGFLEYIPEERPPFIAALKFGGFVLAWVQVHNTVDGPVEEIVIQKFNTAAAPVGDLVTLVSGENLTLTDLEVTTQNTIVAAYDQIDPSEGSSGNGSNAYRVFLTSDGNTNYVRISNSSAYDETGAEIAIAPDGSYFGFAKVVQYEDPTVSYYSESTITATNGAIGGSAHPRNGDGQDAAGIGFGDGAVGFVYTNGSSLYFLRTEGEGLKSTFTQAHSTYPGTALFGVTDMRGLSAVPVSSDRGVMVFYGDNKLWLMEMNSSGPRVDEPPMVVASDLGGRMLMGKPEVAALSANEVLVSWALENEAGTANTTYFRTVELDAPVFRVAMGDGDDAYEINFADWETANESLADNGEVIMERHAFIDRGVVSHDNLTLEGELGASGEFFLAGNVNDIWLTGNAPLTVNGNSLNNFLKGGNGGERFLGGAGNDTILGGAGADYMNGGPGSDVIHVDSQFDVVVESRNWAGHDTVVSSVDFRMGRKHIEDLELTDTAILGAGNGLQNKITGNSQDNILDGGKNNDTMIGGEGDDTYLVRAPGDTVQEQAAEGNDAVRAYRSYALEAHVEQLHMQNVFTKNGTPANLNGIGNALDNTIIGTPYANTIVGREGRDTLKGQGGADTFVFDRAYGPTNVDRIIDFNVGGGGAGDILKMKGAIFGGIGVGTLGAALFRAGTSAADANDRFIFDQASGRLWFDADGSGAGAQHLIATFDQGATLSNTDFEIF
ncbi:calcium-binding protein [Pseudooceanicola atlanticus]|uniref:calcium-binding protein n=1 Tax=Pseudooceanicola atlanticus TaxID=1461694 RepID=UPI000694CB8B|nr:calcium-binding protein [Pseudooceanicola atlanticus]